jgi:FKBP-type peptidyl-prolyl cis-trans isomerase FkpA
MKKLLTLLILVLCLSLAQVAKAQQPTDQQRQAFMEQMQKDEKTLQEYFQKHKIKATQGPNGLFYVATKMGKTAIKEGDQVSVNYTGKFLDGKKFDSNTDPDFKHVQPITITIGKHQVIPGWEFGLPLFKKGGKGTLYIPSGLGYGPNGQGSIPGNAILVFDVEVLSGDAPATATQTQKKQGPSQMDKDEKTLQEYFKKHNINASLGQNGLYYVIDKLGKGAIKEGQKVTVNYTGKFLDGKKFDSNTDPAFKHTEPLTFTLGSHQVIVGWELGIPLFKKGGKGTLYIPSPLAYGKDGQGNIPENSILVFDIEVLDAEAQTAPPPPPPIDKSKAVTKNGVITLPDGMTIKVVNHGTGTTDIAKGDMIQVSMNIHIGDSILFNSLRMTQGRPLPIPVADPRFYGDFAEGFVFLKEGDSAVISYPLDSAIAHKVNLPPFAAHMSGQFLQCEVMIDTVKTAAQVKFENDQRRSNMMHHDDSILDRHFRKKHKTIISDTSARFNIDNPSVDSNVIVLDTSGFYFRIVTPGTGKRPDTGEAVTIDYEYKREIDGQTVLSTTDPHYNHVGKISYIVGRQPYGAPNYPLQESFDRCIRLLRKGGKGIFYVPSQMAFGGRSPGEDLPANSIMILELTLHDIMSAQEFLQKQEDEDKK